MSEAPAPEQLAATVRSGDRAGLARAITLIESLREEDQDVAYEMLRLLMPATGAAHRIAISGPPGVGKSTLIDAFGLLLVEEGHKVAVLAIDPSSTLSRGSILGDKSRMSKLAQEDMAFIRPSPSDLALGGVTRRTREAMFLCEAAGFDRILVETVGVGQSEIQVASMVDSFVVLVQAGAGDELQGIKKGILELADILVVAKADGENISRARQAAAEVSAAMGYLKRESEDWPTRVLSASAVSGEGLVELDALLKEHFEVLTQSGKLRERRTRDLEDWLCQLTEDAILRRARIRDDVQSAVRQSVGDVARGTANALRTALQLASAANS